MIVDDQLMVRKLFELYLKSDERYELVESLSSAAQVEDLFIIKKNYRPYVPEDFRQAL